MNEAPLWLFAYGTLQQPAVQIALFGHTIVGMADTLAGFVRDTIVIADENGAAATAYPILRRTGGAAEALIAGMAFPVDDADLAAADRYEGSSYARIVVTLESGRRAFVYVAPDGAEPSHRG